MKIRLSVAILAIVSLIMVSCGGGTTTAPRGMDPMSALSSIQGALQFKHGKTTMPQQDYEEWVKTAAPAVNQVVKMIEPTGKKLVIVGHADPIGGKNAAIRFGKARAEFVKRVLGKAGVDTSIVKTRSAADNDLQNPTDLKADENHRITFEVE